MWSVFQYLMFRTAGHDSLRCSTRPLIIPYAVNPQRYKRPIRILHDDYERAITFLLS